MSPTLIYIHGQYGSPDEAEHYKPLFPVCEVIGLDYKAQTPWEAERGCRSIGAFYAICALRAGEN